MKTAMILGLLTSSILVSSASATEAMDGAMMQKDAMTTSVSGTTMKKDTIMKDDKMMYMSSMSLMTIVKYSGYNWSKDRKKLATMAGIKNYRGTAKENLIIRAYLLSSMSMADTNMTKKDESKVMKKDESSIIKNDSMKKEAGMYSPYSNTAVSAALSSGKMVYLFFAASWCSGCRALDTNITKDLVTLPMNTVIFKVDYDNSTDLKKQYGVTMQHTVVKLNSDATLAKKILGPNSVAEIIK
jgi:thiol-disulfide isomerase/thioredoxin